MENVGKTLEISIAGEDWSCVWCRHNDWDRWAYGLGYGSVGREGWLISHTEYALNEVTLSVLEEMFQTFKPPSREDVRVFESGTNDGHEAKIIVFDPTRNIPRPHSVSNEFYFAHREMPTDDWAAPYCPAALLGDGTIISIQAGSGKRGHGHNSVPSDSDADFYESFATLDMSNGNRRSREEIGYNPYDLLDKYIEDHGGIVGTATFGWDSDEPEITLF